MAGRSKSERFWDSAAKNYERGGEGPSEYFARSLEYARKFLRPDARVLDVGCGTGPAAVDFAPHVAEVHALDLSAAMLEKASEKATAAGLENISFFHGTLSDLKLEIGTYDLVVAFNVLHLVPDPAALVSRMYELLRPCCHLVIALPCMGELGPLKGLFRLGAGLGLVPRLNFFDHGQVEELIRSSGMKLLESKSLYPRYRQYYFSARK